MTTTNRYFQASMVTHVHAHTRAREPTVGVGQYVILVHYFCTVVSFVKPQQSIHKTNCTFTCVSQNTYPRRVWARLGDCLCEFSSSCFLSFSNNRQVRKRNTHIDYVVPYFATGYRYFTNINYWQYWTNHSTKQVTYILKNVQQTSCLLFDVFHLILQIGISGNAWV